MSKKGLRKQRDQARLEAQRAAHEKAVAQKRQGAARALSVCPGRIQLRGIFESHNMAIDADALTQRAVDMWHIQACAGGRLHHLCTATGSIFRVAVVPPDDGCPNDRLVVYPVQRVSVWVHKGTVGAPIGGSGIGWDCAGRDGVVGYCTSQDVSGGCGAPGCVRVAWEWARVRASAAQRCGNTDAAVTEVIETYVVACNNAGLLPAYGTGDVCDFLGTIFPGKVSSLPPAMAAASLPPRPAGVAA